MKNPTPRIKTPGWGGKGSTWTWRQTRALLIRRDGHKCGKCGIPTHPRCSLRGCGGCTHVGHIVGKADGGTDHPTNLRVECQRCNLVASAIRSTRLRAERSRARRLLSSAALKTSRQW